MSLSTGGIIHVGGGSSSSSSGGSGITEINGQIGPVVTIIGASGIIVAVTGPNEITIGLNGTISASGASKYAQSFSSISSGQFVHGLGTMDVMVQVRDNPSGGGRVLIPDDIIVDSPDFISLVFNHPQSGRVVILG